MQLAEGFMGPFRDRLGQPEPPLPNPAPHPAAGVRPDSVRAKQIHVLTGTACVGSGEEVMEPLVALLWGDTGHSYCDISCHLLQTAAGRWVYTGRYCSRFTGEGTEAQRI